eukprot:9517205-Heterocapsa_arctica.AAC.1
MHDPAHTRCASAHWLGYHVHHVVIQQGVHEYLIHVERHSTEAHVIEEGVIRIRGPSTRRVLAEVSTATEDFRS